MWTDEVVCVLYRFRGLSCAVALEGVFRLVSATLEFQSAVEADPRGVLPVVCSLFGSIRKDPIPDIVVCVKGCTGLISGNIPGSGPTGTLVRN